MTAPTNGSSSGQSNVLKPGCTISSTPKKPAPTASQRARPARSPRNSTPSAITISGEVAAMAWVSASGRYLKASTKTALSITASTERAACSQGRRVRNDARRPLRRTTSQANRQNTP